MRQEVLQVPNFITFLKDARTRLASIIKTALTSFDSQWKGLPKYFLTLISGGSTPHRSLYDPVKDYSPSTKHPTSFVGIVDFIYTRGLCSCYFQKKLALPFLYPIFYCLLAWDASGNDHFVLKNVYLLMTYTR